MNKAFVKKLKVHFRKANKVGKGTISKGADLIVKNPAESALFTVLAAQLIKRTKSRKD